MDHKQAFGIALRELRTKYDVSQEQLAFEAKLDRSYISLIELGRKSPTLDTMEKLGLGLGVPVSAFILRMEALMIDSITQDKSRASTSTGREGEDA